MKKAGLLLIFILTAMNLFGYLSQTKTLNETLMDSWNGWDLYWFFFYEIDKLEKPSTLEVSSSINFEIYKLVGRKQ